MLLQPRVYLLWSVPLYYPLLFYSSDLFRDYRRIIEVSGKAGITSTAQVMDMAREMGRKRGDLFEIAVWKESIFASGNNLRYIQAVHQESDVVPENVDAIRSMMQAMDREKSLSETDRAMQIGGI